MSSDNFDNEVSELYQQRKAQVIAPQISLKELSKARKISTLSLVSIFSAAGITSFSIMAIISHLSTSPVEKTPLYNSTHQIEITKIEPLEEFEETIAVQQPLPPKPVVTQPSEATTLGANREIDKHIFELEDLTAVQIAVSTLPKLQEPRFEIKPTYKVLPKYSQNSLLNQKSGEIQLKYQITALGEVENISIVQSSVSRKLQQSAKKALAKWRYTPSDNFEEHYEIIFEFTVDDMKR
jgi:TonB family protein